ncbi:MAG TPA: TIR domain-containing protein [Chitinophagales bacterium]|nr:TIR domain-containing protein [Chitinophagales bacterium]
MATNFNAAVAKRMVAEGRTELCFKYFDECGIQTNAALQLRARYAQNENDKHSGVLSFQEYRLEQNRILNSLLHLIDEVQQDQMLLDYQQTMDNNVPIMQQNETDYNNTLSTNHTSNSNDTTIPPQPDLASQIDDNNVSNNATTDKPKDIFISYSKFDLRYLNELRTHLSPMVKNNKIRPWDDTDLMAGDAWDKAIRTRLNQADIILLLLSSDFLATEYIWENELQPALERHKAGTVQLVPIILRPCNWQESPIAFLNALPQKGKPISAYQDRDEAWLEVVTALQKII